MNTSTQVGKKLLQLMNEEKMDVTMMKLINMVYIAHGWSLGIRNIPMCSDDAELWRNGPVFRNLYTELILTCNSSSQKLFSDRNLKDVKNGNFSKEDINILKKIVDVYGTLSPVQISELHTNPDSPWSLLKQQVGFQTHTFITIDNDSIRNYYQNNKEQNLIKDYRILKEKEKWK